ncbi:MAG: hypothetical protein JHC61_07390 [Burkholderiaceae bacterium]|nr:hypothetical protein [Burkholderiaceae bacterium]
MNVDLLDFFSRVAMDPALVEQITAMPSQNRLAAAQALARIAAEQGISVPTEDFFPLLNVSPTTTSEAEWQRLTAHVDMHSPVDPGDHQALMARVQVIVERLRIKVFQRPHARTISASYPWRHPPRSCVDSKRFVWRLKASTQGKNAAPAK